MRYYQEQNGDFLAINPESRKYYRQTFGIDAYEGRAVNIEGLPESMATTSIDLEYLSRCVGKRRRDVPAGWLKRLNMEGP